MADADSGNYYVKFITAYGTAPETITTMNWSGSNGKYVMYDITELPVLTYPYGAFKGWYWTETHDEDSKAEIITVSGVGTGLDVSHLTAISGSTYTLYAKWESEQHLINAMDLQNIADAIREYTGLTAGLKPGEWASTFAEGGVSKITFTVSGTSYQAEEGMTWAEWVDSEYNTGGFIVQGSLISKEGDYKNIHTSKSYSPVSATDAIIENHTYYYTYFDPIAPPPAVPEV